METYLLNFFCNFIIKNNACKLFLIVFIKNFNIFFIHLILIIKYRKLIDLKQKDYPDIDITNAFEVFTKVEIKFEDENGAEQNTVLKMIIAHDDCRMQRKEGTAWKSYQHAIQLIEQGKELERLSVVTLTFTNPVPREYDSEAYATWTVV